MGGGISPPAVREPRRPCHKVSPRGRVPFPRGKGTKRRWGTAQDGRFAPIFALPPDPHYGGHPFDTVVTFRRVEIGVVPCVSTRPHRGPGGVENFLYCDFAPAPGCSEPTCLRADGDIGPYEVAEALRRRGGPMWPPANLPPKGKAYQKRRRNAPLILNVPPGRWGHRPLRSGRSVSP